MKVSTLIIFVLLAFLASCHDMRGPRTAQASPYEVCPKIIALDSLRDWRQENGVGFLQKHAGFAVGGVPSEIVENAQCIAETINPLGVYRTVENVLDDLSFGNYSLKRSFSSESSYLIEFQAAGYQVKTLVFLINRSDNRVSDNFVHIAQSSSKRRPR
ncbi:hypothetical protein EH31_08185 [Erythrobacter longus]|uniref:Lipoprotein n=1 Tax=Erythrobacter longus TaxID=1044 RepID=A0A074M5S1_ERYLO|nr:hypothetical protein [Erythrobacter longus]KEO90061.1 hypothetical protein EH31_08185 [Erythrobacter longus]